MADAQLKLSRRALLGVACAVPFAADALPSSAHPERASSLSRGGVEGPSLLHWNRAMARFRGAEAAVAALEGDPDEDAFGDALVACNRALERLLMTPAPDLPALAAKLALARRHLAWELPAGEAAMAALERDAARLAAPIRELGPGAAAQSERIVSEALPAGAGKD